MSLGYEFAPIDVSIITHDKVLDIDRRHRLAAFGLWCWGQCYARTHKTGGLLRRSAVLASLAASVGDLQKLAAELVRVGLWHVAENGWFIHNFEKKSSRNSTERVRKFRERQRESSPPETPDETLKRVSETPTETGGETSLSISPSISVSVSSSEGEPEREPPWFAGVVEAVGMATLTNLRPADCWLRYFGHRAGKGKRIDPNDARYWLTTVMVPEARKEAKDAARQRERDSRFKDHTPKYEAPTPKQSADIARELARRVAEEAKKGAA